MTDFIGVNVKERELVLPSGVFATMYQMKAHHLWTALATEQPLVAIAHFTVLFDGKPRSILELAEMDAEDWIVLADALHTPFAKATAFMKGMKQ